METLSIFCVFSNIFRNIYWTVLRLCDRQKHTCLHTFPRKNCCNGIQGTIYKLSKKRYTFNLPVSRSTANNLKIYYMLTNSIFRDSIKFLKYFRNIYILMSILLKIFKRSFPFIYFKRKGFLSQITWNCKKIWQNTSKLLYQSLKQIQSIFKKVIKDL